jgi:RNA polymerase sigma factor (sigma-70 family)
MTFTPRRACRRSYPRSVDGDEQTAVERAQVGRSSSPAIGGHPSGSRAAPEAVEASALPSGFVDEVGVVEEPGERAFRRHYGQIYRFVRRRTASDQQAEDVTQDVFVDVAAAGGRLRPERQLLLGWLHVVARRRLVDEVRRELRGPSNVLPLEAVGSAAAPDATGTVMLASALPRAIGRLPRGQREVVVLKLLEGRSFAEIGERLDASPAACKMRLVRALEALREMLEEEGMAP